MMMDSYWQAVLHEVTNKNDMNCFFRYTSASDGADLIENDNENLRNIQKVKKKQYIVGEPFPSVYFTEREFNCMVALLRGFTVKQIAKDLALSPRTVEYYIKNLKTKLNCHTRRELMGKALETELIKTTLASEMNN